MSVVSQRKEFIESLDISQKTIVQMVTKLTEDFRAPFNTVRAAVAELSTKVNLAIKVAGSQAQLGAQFNSTK